MQRFTLIQGGYAAEPVDGARWRIDLRAVQGVDAEAGAAWRALIARNAVLDPRTDPDYLLTAARHLAGAEQIAFALAWELGADPVLRGVVPLAIAEPLFRASRARPWWPPGLAARSLVDPGRGAAIHAAVAAQLGSLARPVIYDPVPPRRPVPPENLVGVRPAGYAPPAATVETIREPERVRDAVETFLALDARTARRPIIAEPQEAAMVRVVTRLFARRQQLAVTLASRAGALVAGTIHLGSGAGAIAWRHAGVA